MLLDQILGSILLFNDVDKKASIGISVFFFCKFSKVYQLQTELEGEHMWFDVQ